MMGMTAKRERFLVEKPSSSKPPLPKASRVSEFLLYFLYFPFQNAPFFLQKRYLCKGLLFTICICTIGHFSSVPYILVYHWAEKENNFLWNRSSFQDLVQIQRFSWFIKDPYKSLHFKCSSCSKREVHVGKKSKKSLCKSAVLLSPLLLLRTNSSMITVQTIFRIKSARGILLRTRKNGKEKMTIRSEKSLSIVVDGNSFSFP